MNHRASQQDEQNEWTASSMRNKVENDWVLLQTWTSGLHINAQACMHTPFKIITYINVYHTLLANICGERERERNKKRDTWKNTQHKHRQRDKERETAKYLAKLSESWGEDREAVKERETDYWEEEKHCKR